MAFDIKPQEFHLLSEHYVIRTRVPFDALDEGMIEARVRNNNLSAGDRVTVQCMSHELDTLLHEAEFRVVSRKDSLKRVERGDYNISQVNHVDIVVERVGDWWTSSAGSDGKPVEIKHTKFGSYAVLDADGNELCVVTKEEGGKALAEDILSGQAPLVKAA